MEISASVFSRRLKQHRKQAAQNFLMKSTLGGTTGIVIQLLRRKRIINGILFWAGFVGATEIHEYYKMKTKLEEVFLPSSDLLFDYIPEERECRMKVWRSLKMVSQLERELKQASQQNSSL